MEPAPIPIVPTTIDDFIRRCNVLTETVADYDTLEDAHADIRALAMDNDQEKDTIDTTFGRMIDAVKALCEKVNQAGGRRLRKRRGRKTRRNK
jgi:hypothetical protein